MTHPAKAINRPVRQLHPLTTDDLDKIKFNDPSELNYKLILFPEFKHGANGSIFLYNSNPMQVLKIIIIDDPKWDTTACPVINLKREIDITKLIKDEHLLGANKIFKIKPTDPINKYIAENSSKKLNADRDKIIILMDLQGCSSDIYFKARDQISLDDVVGFMYEVVCGIDVLHNIYKIIHRDIKPQNLLLCIDGRVIFVDFGIAKHILLNNDNNTEKKGTPLYMSPQVWEGKDYNESTDLFSARFVWGRALGIEFDGCNYVAQKYSDIIESQLNKLKKHLNDIDYPLKDVLMNMYSMEQNKCTCKELIGTLEEYIKTNNISIEQLRMNRKTIVREETKKGLMKWHRKHLSIQMESGHVKNKLIQLSKSKLSDESEKQFVEEILGLVNPKEKWIGDKDKSQFLKLCESWFKEFNEENINTNTIQGVLGEAWDDFTKAIERESKEWSDNIIAQIINNKNENTDTDNKIDIDNECEKENTCDGGNMNINKHVNEKQNNEIETSTNTIKKSNRKKRKEMDSEFTDEPAKKKRKIDTTQTL